MNCVCAAATATEASTGTRSERVTFSRRCDCCELAATRRGAGRRRVAGRTRRRGEQRACARGTPPDPSLSYETARRRRRRRRRHRRQQQVNLCSSYYTARRTKFPARRDRRTDGRTDGTRPGETRQKSPRDGVRERLVVNGVKNKRPPQSTSVQYRRVDVKRCFARRVVVGHMENTSPCG